MTGNLAAGLGKDHCPRNEVGVGGSAPEFAINKVTKTTEGKTQWHQGGDIVCKGPEPLLKGQWMGNCWQTLLVKPKRLTKVRPARREKHQRNNNAKQTPMKGHAALPKCEGFEGMACKIAWLIKQDIAQPAPNNHTQDPKEEQVLKVSHRHA